MGFVLNKALIRDPQFRIEGTRGEGIPASSSMTKIAHTALWVPRYDLNELINRVAYGEDPADIFETVLDVGYSMRFQIIDTNILQHGWNRSGGRTAYQTLATITKVTIPVDDVDTDMWFILKNTRIGVGSVRAMAGGPIIADCFFSGKIDSDGFTLTEPADISYESISTPSGAKMTVDGGNQPLKITKVATPFYPSMRSVVFSVDNNLTFIPEASASRTWVDNPPGERRLMGQVGLNMKDKLYWNMGVLNSYVDLEWTIIASGAHKLIMSSTKPTKGALPFDVTGAAFGGLGGLAGFGGLGRLGAEEVVEMYSFPASLGGSMS